MDLNVVIGHTMSAAGIGVSIGIAIWSTRQLRRSVGVTLSLDIRRNIERLERNKEKFKQRSPEAYSEFFDVQGELETVDAKLKTIFKLKEKDFAAGKNRT